MTRRRNRADDAAEHTRKQRIWNLSANASAETIADWDIKPDFFVEGVLQLLASGTAVMLGTTMNGGAVSVTLYQGDDKQRVYVTDSIEWDDLWIAIVNQAKERVNEAKPEKIRSIGD